MVPQKDEADALEADAYEALEATPERGADFAAAVRAVLADETHWVRWKKDAVPDAAGKVMTCASFQRPPYRELATMQKGRGKRPGGEAEERPSFVAGPLVCAGRSGLLAVGLSYEASFGSSMTASQSALPTSALSVDGIVRRTGS